MDLITMILTATILLKLCAVSNSIRWIRHHGSDYVSTVEGNNPTIRDDEHLNKILDALSGGFFPFGVRDYRLKRYIASLRTAGKLKRIWANVVRTFQAALFQYRYLVLIGSAHLMAMSLVPGIRFPVSIAVPEAAHRYLLFTMVLSLFAMNILMEVEAASGYVTMTDYGRYYYLLRAKDSRYAQLPQLMIELRFFLEMTLAILATGAAAVFFVHSSFGGFCGQIIPYSAAHPADWIVLFSQCLYFVVTTMTTVGYGDIEPGDGFGQAVAGIIQIESFVLVIVVLSIFLSTRRRQ